MILYSSSPDGVAAQQLQYDQLYNGNNQNNASRYDAAQARALQAMLTQRENDQRAQDSADTSAEQSNQFNQRMAFEGQQGDLNRASAQKNVETQYATTHIDRKAAINAKDFEQAQELAKIGQTPQTEDKLKLQYPNFDSNQIKVLANASGQYGLSKFQNAFQQSIKNGQPLPVESIKNYVQPESPFYQDALDHRIAELAAPQAIYNSDLEKARKGNFSDAITKRLAGINPNVNSTAGLDLIPNKNQTMLQNVESVASDFTAPITRWIPKVAAAGMNYFSPPEQIQPNGDWQERAANVASTLRSSNDQGVLIDASTGKLVPASQNPSGPAATPIIAPSSSVVSVSQPSNAQKPTRQIAAQFVKSYGQIMAKQKLIEAGYDPSGYSN